MQCSLAQVIRRAQWTFLHNRFAKRGRVLNSRVFNLIAGYSCPKARLRSLTWIRSVQPSSVEFSADITASLYVRTPINSKPTREATSVNTPRACSSQRLLESIGPRCESQEAPLLWEELSALSEDAVVDAVLPFQDPSFGESVLLGGRSSRSGGVGALMLVFSYGSTCFVAGEEDPVGEVSLLPRDFGRDDSKEVDEELVSSDGARSPGVLDEAAGSMMIRFAL